MAWQDFVALKWPALVQDGEPSPGPSPTQNFGYNHGSYTTVWETYIEARDMFPDDGSAPNAFGSPHDVPDVCAAAGDSQGLLLERIAKSGTSTFQNDDSVLDEYIQANRMGPVVDLNGNFLRSGINFNEVMYDYVVENQLYNAPGQEAFDADDSDRDATPVIWPRGLYSAEDSGLNVGSIMVKSSWTLLDGGKDPSDFHSVQVYIYNRGGGVFGQEPTVPETREIVTVGLVGFHYSRIYFSKLYIIGFEFLLLSVATSHDSEAV